MTSDRETVARICGIRAQNEGADVLLSILTEEDEKKQLTITMEQFLDLHVKKGEALSSERLEALEEAAAFCGAFIAGTNEYARYKFIFDFVLFKYYTMICVFLFYLI